MNITVLGAGIIGISTAWHLAQRGHRVTVIDRQPDAALETSFSNAGQISVSYCEPWANREAPLKALKWMFSKEAPLLFRPQNPFGKGFAQYAWGLEFLANCNDAAFERNVDMSNSHYKAEFEAQKARLDRGGNNRFKLPATAVLDKLILALERPNPKPHYYVTTPTHVVALLRRILPSRLLHAFAARNSD